jgi:hypothetical protein
MNEDQDRPGWVFCALMRRVMCAHEWVNDSLERGDVTAFLIHAYMFSFAWVPIGVLLVHRLGFGPSLEQVLGWLFSPGPGGIVGLLISLPWLLVYVPVFVIGVPAGLEWLVWRAAVGVKRNETLTARQLLLGVVVFVLLVVIVLWEYMYSGSGGE